MLRRFSIRRRRPSVKTFNVVALDGATLSFNLDSRSNGKELLDKVLQECAITSVDKLHFSLATQEDKYLKWILLQKPLKKQLSGHSPYTLLFRVHIYPYNHHSLVQSLTRHYLYLQIKQDLRHNRLQPSSPTAVTRIASLLVQGEIGNYIPQACSNGYIEDLQILPNMTNGMEEAIRQAHRLNRGRLPGECEEEVLDLAQEEPTYGSVYYNIQDSHRQPVTVCVCPVGIRVAQGGRQINCFKWESITKVTNRGKHVYLHIDASQTLAAYQMHYISPSTQMAITIASWCQVLVNFYCSVVQEEINTKSRLKRFFSTRRSLRRGSQVRRQTTYVYPGSNPVQRRSRRASVTGDVQINKNSSKSPSQIKKSLEQQSDSKLVIYGLSGLASQPDEDQELPTPTQSLNHSVASPNHEPSQVLSPMPEMGATDVFHEDELGGVELLPTMDTILHVIQEEKSMHMGSSSSSLARRDEHMVHQGSIGSEGVKSTTSSRSPRQEKRRDGLEGGGYGGGGERRGEHQWYLPAQGSVTDVEHKSVSSLIQPRHVVPGHSETHKSPPPIPPRAYSEAELSRRGYDKESDKSSYVPRQHHHRHRHHNSRGSQQGREYNHNSRGSQPGSEYSRNSRGSQPGSEYSRSSRGLQPGSEYNRSSRGSQPGSEYSRSSRGSQPGSEYNHSSRSQPSPREEYSGEESWYHHQNGDTSHAHNRRGSQPVRDYNGRVSLSPRHTQHESSSQSRHHHTPHTHSNGGVSPSRHYAHRDRLNGRSPSTPQIYLSTSPHHRSSLHHTHTSQHHASPHRSPRHRPYGGSMSEIGRYHSSQPQSRADTLSPASHSSSGQPHHYSQPSSANHSLRRTYHSNVEDTQPNSQWQENSGRSSAGDDQLSYDSGSYQEEVLVNGSRSADYNPPPRQRGSHFPAAHDVRRREPSRSSLRAYRRYSSGDTVGASENTAWEQGRAGEHRSPASTGTGEHKHFRYPAASTSHNYHHQGWKGGHYNGAWQEEEEQQRTTSSLPLHTNPDYSLYEEDEEMMDRIEEERAKAQVSSRSRASAPHLHDGGLHESGRHVSRQHRLRHSTITSLTSLSSDITAGMSRLGSIASLDYQASFAELSQTDSVSGYIDPHVRSLVFEASQNSQGTEL